MPDLKLTEEQKKNLILNRGVYTTMPRADRNFVRQSLVDRLNSRIPFFKPDKQERLEIEAELGSLDAVDEAEDLARQQNKILPSEWRPGEVSVEELKKRIEAMHEGQARLAYDIIDEPKADLYTNTGEVRGNVTAHGESMNRTMKELQKKLKEAKKRKK